MHAIGETVGYGIGAVWGTAWIYVGLRWRHYLVGMTLRSRRALREWLPPPLRWLLMPPRFVSPRWVTGELVFLVVLFAVVTAIMWACFIGGVYETVATGPG
ncbi:MAG: hypothetical protein JSV79_10945 [Armatimonadota bacterium]|nr:MAG: hypothetical protein JSV79_10945 [Armatimonadota bacterium]